MRGKTAVGAMGVFTVLSAVAPSARAQQLQPPPPLGGWGAPSPYPSPPGQSWGAPPPPPTVTQQRLERSEREDSGRGLELVWANAELGGSFVALGSDIGMNQTSGAGGMLGAGLGLRFIFWTVGARFRAMPSGPFTVMEINGEGGFHLPLGPWDPYLNLHGGYVASALNSAAAPSGFPTPHGFDVGASIGGDYYLSSLFSLGIDVTGDALFTKRDATVLDAAVLHTDTSMSRSSVGVAVLGSLHAGLHFDL